MVLRPARITFVALILTDIEVIKSYLAGRMVTNGSREAVTRKRASTGSIAGSITINALILVGVVGGAAINAEGGVILITGLASKRASRSLNFDASTLVDGVRVFAAEAFCGVIFSAMKAISWTN